MTFYQNIGLTKVCISLDRSFFLPIKWVHDDFIYVIFAGMRNTKTWSKSSPWYDSCKNPTTTYLYI